MALHELTSGAAFIRVLEVDPELATGLDEDDRPAAIAAAVSPVFELDPGPWRFFPKVDRGALGALILDGLIIVRVKAGTRTHAEVLGEGDVFSPWVRTARELNVGLHVAVEVYQPTRIALLNRKFALRTARWPEIHAALCHRLVTRSRRLNLQLAINAVPRCEERLDLTLWHLGDRLGRVSVDGILLALPFTHGLLAQIIGVQRPSVTIALQKLEEDGRLIRQAPGRWVLRGDPPPRFLPLTRQTGLRS